MEVGGWCWIIVWFGCWVEIDGYCVCVGVGFGVVGYVWSVLVCVVVCGGVFGGCCVRICVGLWLVGMVFLLVYW